MLCVKKMDKNYAFNKPGTAEKIIGGQSEGSRKTLRVLAGHRLLMDGAGDPSLIP